MQNKKNLDILTVTLAKAFKMSLCGLFYVIIFPVTLIA